MISRAGAASTKFMLSSAWNFSTPKNKNKNQTPMSLLPTISLANSYGCYVVISKPPTLQQTGSLSPLVPTLSLKISACNPTNSASLPTFPDFVFHASLLKPYNDPSEFSPHVPPELYQFVEDSTLSISSILDCRKIGHRYGYLVHWHSLPNSSIPLFDDPPLPRAPWRHPITLRQSFSSSNTNNVSSPSSTSENHKS
jgi:hypothetical protein